jgi:RNA polymerase sigma-70 factor (ECF subfamily)
MRLAGLAAARPGLEQLTDDQIVRRVLEGEVPLFEILMRRHNQRIYRAVRSIIRDEHEAEDVMQQAYVNAYTHLDQFAGRAKFSTWLTRIAVYEALARVRKGRTAAQTEEPGSDQDEVERVPSRIPDPEQQAMSKDIREVLQTVIDSLPESYRMVLMLREVEGASTTEVADCLEVSEEVVKTRLHRARSMVREGLYDRAGISSENLYAFHDPRCDRVVGGVFEAINGIAPTRLH